MLFNTHFLFRNLHSHLWQLQTAIIGENWALVAESGVGGGEGGDYSSASALQLRVSQMMTVTQCRLFLKKEEMLWAP